MALSTTRDMIENAEKALRRGDLRLAGLYVNRARQLTRKDRQSIGSDSAKRYYLGLDLASILNGMGKAFDSVNRAISDFTDALKKSFGELPPSQGDFTLAN